MTTFEHCADGDEDRGLVERHERAQVEHHDRGVVEVLGRLERGVHHRAVRDHDEIAALARDAGLNGVSYEPSGTSPLTRR